MSFPCEIKEQPEQNTLVIRTRSSVENLPNLLGQCYGAIYQYMAQSGEMPSGPPFTAYYNMDMQDLDVEIGFPVSRELPARENIQPGKIAGGKVATCLYIGVYSEMGPAYDALNEFIQASGNQPSIPVYEFYLSDPQVTPPDQHQTLILFPLV